MRDLNAWLAEYAESHRHPTNVLIHKIFVPLIMWCVVALLWCIPTPEVFPAEYFVNWSTLFVAFCLVFYLTLSFKMFVGMTIMSTIMALVSYKIDQMGQYTLLISSAAVFVFSWVMQFIGHKYEGKKPSFLKDIVFLLIGPLWVLNSFFKKVGMAEAA